VETIREAVDEVLMEHSIDQRAIKCAASIDLKAEEAGLLQYCGEQKLPVTFYTAEELKAVPGEFTPSVFVQSITGVDNVCERAALIGAEKLIVKKTARNGVTVALAEEHWEVHFG
jgi:cobalt-precorrin 5A hydrolase